MSQLAASLCVALVLGMRHALEPDHLAAVSTLLAQRPARRSRLRGDALLGALWGLGHGLALLLVGGLLVLLRSRLVAPLADAFELLVASMLLLLGLRAVAHALRLGELGAITAHAHRARSHVHAGPAAHLHLGALTLARGPLLVGLVHGLAGSGALTVLSLANVKGVAPALAYMLLFGAGSMVGMALLAGALGLPLARLSHRSSAQVWLCGAAGVASVGLSFLWGAPVVLRLLAA